MGLNGIISNALTTLQTNTAALRVVSGNVANVNTPDYARRQVNLQTLSAGGSVAGVDIASVQRVVDQYLSQETLAATASSARYDTQSSAFDQINALLGSPGDGAALTSKLTSVFTALGKAALSPATSSSQQSVTGAMRDLASSVSSLSDSLSSLAVRADSQLGTSVAEANSLIKQIYDFNQQIQTACTTGVTDSALLDQRDTALTSLSKLIDVRTSQQDNGAVLVSTQDGINLVGDTYAQLSYVPGANGVFQPIMLQDTNPRTGQTVGQAQSLDRHLAGGQIKGLIDVRDQTIPELKNELGAFAQGVALSFNEVHNANSACPPPETLSGSDTGLLAGDALNFAGQTRIAVTDANGTLQHTIAVDFTNGTLSIDGTVQAGAFPTTIGGLATVLNSALASTGGTGASASFADGTLALSAGDGRGIVVSDPDADATTVPPTVPSSRGGYGFSQFFGLNDLFRSSVPSILSTGVSGSDLAGVAANGEIDLVLKGPNGEIARQAAVSVLKDSGGTVTDFDDVVNALNTQMAGYASFALNSDGSLTATVSPGYAGYTLQVAKDTTTRGSTGVSLSELFGLGANGMAQQASGFALNPAIDHDPSLISFAQADFANSQLVSSGDSRGLLALQNLATAQQTFARAGNLGAQVISLSNYAGALYQDVATRSNAATTAKTTQDDRLAEAQTRLAGDSGVSLDEELSNMIMYQQAYSAGARMLTVAGQLFDTLLQTV